METTVLSLIGLVIAVGIVLIVIPAFNNLTGKALTFDSMGNLPMVFGMMGIVLLTGIFAGSYPAFFLSGFTPDRALRGTLSQGLKSSILRKIFVVFQFALSVMLIICTGVILDQIKFMKNKELGFRKDQVMVVNIKTGPVIQNPKPVSNQLLMNPNISDVTASTGVPGRVYELRFFVPEGSDQSQSHAMKVIRSDHKYVHTFGLQIVAGRDFSEEIITDPSDAFIVNETGARKLGWTPEEAVGKELEFMTVIKGHIVGVIKDFHYRSMRNSIEPLVIMNQGARFGFAAFRINKENVPETIAYVEKAWKKFEPEHDFSYFFVDEIFDAMYASEEKTSQIFSMFALLAIFIACLGLFGLASFTAQQRTREIGIRKVLGATVSGIVMNLTMEFLKWVVAANVIAIPVAILLLRKYWLANFSFQAGLSIWTFVLASGISAAIAFLTVYYQSFKAATANPVNSIRNE
jgi:putative ABC transport system permease protein